MKIWALNAVAIATVALMACGSSGATGTGIGSGGTGVTVAASSSSSSSSGTGGTGGADAGDPCASMTDCSQCATQMLCGTCCEASQMTAYDNFINYIVGDCACGAGDAGASSAPCNAPCTAAPGDICTNPNATPSNACVTCINGLANTQACIMAAQTACVADATCKPILVCGSACPM